MLSDSFDELIQAIRDGNEKLQERIYRRLEKAGMDRMTAKIVVRDLMKENGE